MLVTNLSNEVVDKGLCIGCGMCTAVNAGREKPLLRMEYSGEYDHAIPIVVPGPIDDDPLVLCPGASMNMAKLSNMIYGSVPEDSWVGHHQRIRAAHSTDAEMRKRSASGGVTTAILSYLFKKQAIDAVFCVVSEGAPYNGSGKILRSAEELLGTHGSTYHPAVIGAELSALIEGTERFAFVGLPCEIATLELLKKQNPLLAARHVLSIGLFCGGINRFGGINYYLKKFGVGLENSVNIDYRYGEWPGKIRLVDSKGKAHEIARIRGNSRWNILRYVVGFQGYWMLPRCRMCPDQISDFADIAVGDPHLKRFRSEQGLGHSAVVLRSNRGVEWYDKALADGFIVDESLEREELIESQGFTLDNRRHALAYSKVARYLGMSAPEISNYSAFEKPKFRHYKYAVVDMLKIRFRKIRLLRSLYIPIQAFEYLFITLAPRVVMSRLANLFRNK